MWLDPVGVVFVPVSFKGGPYVCVCVHACAGHGAWKWVLHI